MKITGKRKLKNKAVGLLRMDRKLARVMATKALYWL